MDNIIIYGEIMGLIERIKSYLTVLHFKAKAVQGAKFLRNEDASHMTNLVQELTTVALMVALVLVPIGIQYLNTVNTTGMSEAETSAIGAISMIIIVAVILAILDAALKGKKGGR
jgi:hypothetical protein